MRASGRSAPTIGVIFGGAAVYLCLVGIIETFSRRWVVADVVSLGHVVLLAVGVGAGYVAASAPARRGQKPGPLAGPGAGVVVGASLAVLLLAGAAVNLRTMFINASPTLYELLAFGRSLQEGVALLLLLGAAAGAGGSALAAMSARARRVFLTGLVAVLIVGVFQDLLQLLLQGPAVVTMLRGALFTTDGPSAGGAAAICGLTWAAVAARARYGDALQRGAASLSPSGRRGLQVLRWTVALALLLVVPIAGGPFVAQVMVLVGLYTLMGLGLNLEVGFAGLLDLGFVAFFAIGAYTMALLTSRGEYGIAHWSFWAAVPVAMGVSLVAGVLFGIPVLRVRGDYLAIATLGLGEIVRLLVLSDALRPWLGGSFGVLLIPKPRIGGWELSGPRELYYLTLVASGLIAYVASRLQDSPLGRAWMAIREDEDVAQAIGINLVTTKLLAYGLGGAMGGVGGAIFAVLVGSVFPQSFSLLISINVLVLIILGGLGSLWGVVVGALVLVGLPELLREFGDYRFLVYGIVLVAMMLFRPEGLLPAAAQRRELHAGEDASPPAPRPAVSVAGTGSVEG
ncbi:MAG TPA: branched-chain amino acid ABC transporter permease [bacterium]|nr:branched-chain amino acid ABC transporter permease [bacterium]